MVFKKLAVTCLVALGAVQLASARTLPEDVSVERRLANPFPTSPFPPPSQDPFYRKPANLASFAPGDIIRSRDITTEIVPGLDSSLIASAYQLAYKTRTATNAPDVTVTSVYKPKNPKFPAQVLAISMFQDAAALDCANSFGLLKNTNSNHTLVAVAQVALFNAALNKGYYVTAPDFEGSEAAFIAGFAEGPGMLDGIRAILRHRKTIPNPAGNEVIITGYSGGGHGASWAVQLANEYAPELNIIGAAYGGTPVDLESVLVQLNKNLFAGFGVAGLAGVANAYPELEAWLKDNINAEGLQIFKNLRTGAFCVPALLGNYSYKDYFALVKDGAAALKKAIPQKYFKLNLLGGRGKKDLVTKFPRLIYHAQFDQVIPEPPASKYVDDQCAGGASIEYSLAIAEHASETLIGLPKAFNWIVARFDKKLNQQGCTRTTHSLANLFDPLFALNAGPTATRQARAKAGLNFFNL